MFRTPLVLASLFVSGAVAYANPKPLKKPPSVYKVGGQSVSKLDPDHLEELAEGAAKALGYKVSGPYVRGDCLWEGVSIGVQPSDAKYDDKTAENYTLYFKRPAAKPEDGCDPKEGVPPAKDAILGSEGVVHALDKKADVMVAIQPSYDRYGIKTPPDKRSAMAKTAKKLFDSIYVK